MIESLSVDEYCKYVGGAESTGAVREGAFWYDKINGKNYTIIGDHTYIYLRFDNEDWRLILDYPIETSIALSKRKQKLEML
jgi:hypothetical protein